jgi:hypothetical protein
MKDLTSVGPKGAPSLAIISRLWPSTVTRTGHIELAPIIKQNAKQFRFVRYFLRVSGAFPTEA